MEEKTTNQIAPQKWIINKTYWRKASLSCGPRRFEPTRRSAPRARVCPRTNAAQQAIGWSDYGRPIGIAAMLTHSFRGGVMSIYLYRHTTGIIWRRKKGSVLINQREGYKCGARNASAHFMRLQQK